MNIKDYKKKVQGKGEVNMSLYEINQSIIGQLPKYESEQIKDLEKKIDEWNASEENQSKKFFMFLCRDIHYYTIFCLDPEQAEFRSLGEGITYLLQQAGYTVHSEEILDDHCEIWIKNDDNAGAYVAMLFPYDQGVVYYG